MSYNCSSLDTTPYSAKNPETVTDGNLMLIYINHYPSNQTSSKYLIIPIRVRKASLLPSCSRRS